MKPLHSKLKAALTVVVLGVAAASFYACLLPVGDGLAPGGGLLTATGDPQPKIKDFYKEEVQPIFTAHCVICHNPNGPGYAQTGGANGGLNLTDSATVYSTLVGVATFEVPGTAPTLRVDSTGATNGPAALANSYLYQKINSATPKSGDRMPQGGPYLLSPDIATIATWIQNGAKP